MVCAWVRIETFWSDCDNRVSTERTLLSAFIGSTSRKACNRTPEFVSLISDTNSGVRLQALRLVEPMKADSNVRSVLTRLSQSDQNVSIRTQAHTMLAQMPEMD